MPTEHARGPWDPQALHGGAPAALIADAFERLEPGIGAAHRAPRLRAAAPDPVRTADAVHAHRPSRTARAGARRRDAAPAPRTAGRSSAARARCACRRSPPRLPPPRSCRRPPRSSPPPRSASRPPHRRTGPPTPAPLPMSYRRPSRARRCASRLDEETSTARASPPARWRCAGSATPGSAAPGACGCACATRCSRVAS